MEPLLTSHLIQINQATHLSEFFNQVLKVLKCSYETKSLARSLFQSQAFSYSSILLCVSLFAVNAAPLNLHLCVCCESRPLITCTRFTFMSFPVLLSRGSGCRLALSDTCAFLFNFFYLNLSTFYNSSQVVKTRTKN